MGNNDIQCTALKVGAKYFIYMNSVQKFQTGEKKHLHTVKSLKKYKKMIFEPAKTTGEGIYLNKRIFFSNTGTY